MVGLSTDSPDGTFWYVLDDKSNIAWQPLPRLRGDFYLSWLGQNRNVVGAGLARIAQGRLTHICTHGTPYFWLQPYEVLSFTSETMQAQQVLGAGTMALDFSLAGWGMRDQTPSQVLQWPDAPISTATLQPLLSQAITVITHGFGIEGKPASRAESGGLLTRVANTHPPDPLEGLLDLLREGLEEPNVVPALVELVRHDVNVVPSYHQSDLFGNVPVNEKSLSPSRAAHLVLSAIYHLAPRLSSQRLNNMLLLNSLRQRHPFDITWGAEFLVKCFGMSGLVHLLQAALQKEESVQIRGNVLDLLQELGYGLNAGLEDKILNVLTNLLSKAGSGAFSQVVGSHLAFIREYLRQRDAAHSIV